MKKRVRRFFLKLFKLKIYFYKNVLSTIKPIGDFSIKQPCLFLGHGKIQIASGCVLGYEPSPYLYSGYMHIEARHADSVIKIGSRTAINNSACIISDGASIEIGDDCLIGYNFHVYDTDFHGIEPDKRACPSPASPVLIGNNCFIGSNVMILKGVSIGENSTIASNSVVTKAFPSNVVIGGNPAKIIKALKNESVHSLEERVEDNVSS